MKCFIEEIGNGTDGIIVSIELSEYHSVTITGDTIFLENKKWNPIIVGIPVCCLNSHEGTIFITNMDSEESEDSEILFDELNYSGILFDGLNELYNIIRKLNSFSFIDFMILLNESDELNSGLYFYDINNRCFKSGVQ